MDENSHLKMIIFMDNIFFMKLSYLLFALALVSLHYSTFVPSTFALSSLESKWVQIITSPNVDTDPPSWRRKLDSSDLRERLAILPNTGDRIGDEYIIMPEIGIITPLIHTPETDPRYADIVAGKSLDVNDFLQQWVHHYPGTTLPWQTGNALIGWHSNFYKNQKTDFTAIFGTLPMLDPGDEVWYYRRVSEWLWSDQSWIKYRYTVTRSYETVANDGWVFDPIGSGSELTFYTCVPIGTSQKRWIVRVNLESSQQIYYPIMTQSYNNISWYDGLDPFVQEQLRTLISSGASQSEIQALIESGSDHILTTSGTIVSDLSVMQVQADAVTKGVLPWWTKLYNWIISLF